MSYRGRRHGYVLRILIVPTGQSSEGYAQRALKVNALAGVLLS